MICENCLYNKNCQFLLKHKTANSVDECTAFEDKSEWVHLPCKVGSTIFMPWRWNGENGITQLTVLQIVLTEDESYVETNLESDDYDYFTYYNGGRFWFDDFGIMVFSTKKEAEKALAERIKQND